MSKDLWPIIGAVVLLLGSMYIIWRFKQAGYTIDATITASPSATLAPKK